MTKIEPKTRYHRIDGWRGYQVPKHAIVGASDTGDWGDSPAPHDEVMAELRRFGREVLRPAKIKYRIGFSQSSNVFMLKRWLTVRPHEFDRAAQLAMDWLEAHSNDTRYIHEADLEQLGYQPTREPAHA